MKWKDNILCFLILECKNICAVHSRYYFLKWWDVWSGRMMPKSQPWLPNLIRRRSSGRTLKRERRSVAPKIPPIAKEEFLSRKCLLFLKTFFPTELKKKKEGENVIFVEMAFLVAFLTNAEFMRLTHKKRNLFLVVVSPFFQVWWFFLWLSLSGTASF